MQWILPITTNGRSSHMFKIVVVAAFLLTANSTLARDRPQVGGQVRPSLVSMDFQTR